MGAKILVYLIRHGEAVDEKVDPARPLTEKGKDEVAQTAAFMKNAGVKADEIWHSAKLRAKQTAEIVAQVLELKDLIEKQGLKPNDPVAPLADLVNKSSKNIIIVGHLPFLAKLAALLITGSEDKQVLGFRSAGLARLEKSGSTWNLQ